MRHAILALAACGSQPTIGTLTIDGQATPIAACRVVENAHRDGVALDLVHARGRLRFTRQHLYSTAHVDDLDDGTELTCAKLDRRWGGGIRPGGGGYWKGMLDVRCDRVVGRIELACGDPTPEETRQLDDNAAAARRGSGSALP